MDSKEWTERYRKRTDITVRLTHLTKGEDDDHAFKNLMKILDKKCINGSSTETGYICGDKSAVCFQDAPLEALAQNLLYEKELRDSTGGKIRYLGFGLRFYKKYIFFKGGRPVIYDITEDAKEYLPSEQWWRIVNLDLRKKNYMIDWTHEREWRVPGSLNFEYKKCEIILPNHTYYKKFIEYCIDNDKTELLKEIRGIIILKSVYA